MDKFVSGYIIGVLVCTLGFLICAPDSTTIKSENKITPLIELVIKDNKLDTLYVYKLKK